MEVEIIHPCHLGKAGDRVTLSMDVARRMMQAGYVIPAAGIDARRAAEKAQRERAEKAAASAPAGRKGRKPQKAEAPEAPESARRKDAGDE